MIPRPRPPQAPRASQSPVAPVYAAVLRAARLRLAVAVVAVPLVIAPLRCDRPTSGSRPHVSAVKNGTATLSY
ncbi:hypothetical protein BIWAKO_02801 [Bosea sp. BIWAKO-01]|nr:hypothetical protein BIWAKO_02801 [Bosea sp. BIWAKO-01]